MKELTPHQRRRICSFRSQGYREDRICELVKVSVEQVRSTTRRGRPPKPEPSDGEHAKCALADALKKKSVSERFKAVKCVLANFGDLLGYTVDDAKKVIEKHLAKNTT